MLVLRWKLGLTHNANCVLVILSFSFLRRYVLESEARTGRTDGQTDRHDAMDMRLYRR